MRSSNVKNGEIVDADNVYVNDKAVTSENVHEGDIIVVVRNGSRALIGKHAQIKASMPNTVIGAFMSGMRSEHSSFVNALLDTSAFENEIAKNMGATINQITGYMFSKMEFMIPSGDEQQKIGEHFQSLDNLITLHQRITPYFLKINAFVWEQRKLGDVFKEYSEKNHTELPALTIIQGGGTVKREDSDRNLMYDKSNLSNYKMVRKDDFIVHLRSFEGGLEKASSDGIISPAYHTFHSDVADSRFYYPYFRSHEFIKHKLVPHVYGIRDGRSIDIDGMKTIEIPYTSTEEQQKIGDYLESIDHHITLHQRKPYFWNKFIVIDWEQRKLGDVLERRIEQRQQSEEYPRLAFASGQGVIPLSERKTNNREQLTKDEYTKKYLVTELNDIVYNPANVKYGAIDRNKCGRGLISPIYVTFTTNEIPGFIERIVTSHDFQQRALRFEEGTVTKRQSVNPEDLVTLDILVAPKREEQQKIATYFDSLDHLITLHHHKLFIINGLKLFTAIQCKCYLLLNISNKNKKTKKEIKLMPELERVIEEKLIDQLVYGDSQWTYREDLKTEEDLWRNFKYILEQNNKDRLNGESLSDAEFEQVKNQLQFSSFYKAGEWLVGENGKVMVHVQRDTEKLHLVVMNHEHIAGGSSVYEVINQYSALKDEDDYYTVSRNRRFDVTLMINGLPMIHIELKNRQHSYMDGFNQIKKYISEGKFTGIFSAVQMFVVSNGVDTKYFAAASDTDLNAKFMSGWVDEKNNPVSDYLDFAKSVLRIPEAHEMIARYTVLDRDAKRLIILRPYQIHAIESIREASKIGKSGFVWHTTGSGKTLTSYKATRNLLMDIPSLDKTIFLIDRKDLDTQTSSAFQAYANNDVIAVDKTDNVNDLKKKLKSGDRKVIVTTIQKMQILVTKRLQEDTPEYNKIKNLRIAFVVDECHRAVTPKTKRELERFFGRSLWFGFTGTPRFAENPYAQMGDLPRTTEELYGKCLHKYTIQNAIKDNAVLGFQVEHNGPKNMEDETDPSLYDNETHMLRVLDIILNKSYQKFGLQNGKGQTYEAILTTSSIQLAQKYYELLSKVKNGETDLEIDERMKQVLPDYPKFAITYSVTENEEGSHVNQEKMQKSLNDYNEIIYIFLTIFLYLLKCPQSLILSALRAFCFCGKPHISRSIFLYFRYQAWLKSW